MDRKEAGRHSVEKITSRKTYQWGTHSGSPEFKPINFYFVAR